MNGECIPNKGQPYAEPSALPLVSEEGDAAPPGPATNEQLQAAEQKIEERMSGFERSTIRLSRVAIGVSIVVGLAVCAQWREMRKATNAATESTANTEAFFKTDERAWVVLKITPLEIYPAFNQFPARIKYGFYPKNLGKTIARNLRIHVDSVYGKDGGAAILGPQSLAPGEDAPTSLVISGDAPSNLTTSFMGRIEYVDAFDASHWKTFCYRLIDAKGTLEHCETGNDEDHNPN